MKDKIIAELQKLLAEKDKIIDKLNKLISALLLCIANLEKDSSTSSEPQSSEIVKPSKTLPLPNGQKRKSDG